jgi:hypothetical protein
MQTAGAKGNNLQKFCTAVATGIIEAITGQTFTTIDVGTITGAGTGTGIGIIGLSASSMEEIALASMSSTGKNAAPMMQAIMTAVVAYLGSAATLSTVDSPVFIGTGTIVVGSISVSASVMGSDIDSQLQSSGANGKNRTNLSDAIANGICSGILSSGTGAVVISGTGIPTGPGTGVGTGIIS